jgi:CheY-like chemotaxis protein
MWIGGKRLECVCAPFRCDGGKRATALDEKDGMRGMAKILCIDDDKYLMDLLSYGLTRAGFEVVTECSGRAGLGALYEGRVDLVILAVNIPDMNGFKILTALRAFSQVPVIMLTARAQDEDVMAGFAGGADDYYLSPENIPHIRRPEPAWVVPERLERQPAPWA